MAGKHAQGRTSRPSRRSLPLLAGTAVAAVLTGTTVAALGLSPSSHNDRAAQTAADSVDRTLERADRSEERSAAPETTPSATPSAVPTSASPSPVAPPPPSPSPKPSKTVTVAAKPPSGAGAVVSTGTCQASFYTDQGSRTADGETFNTSAFTAAHKTLPFNTRVRVTNVSNGKSVVVRINDRGPFVANRCLDLTPAAFNTISNTSAGVATVKFEVLQG